MFYIYSTCSHSKCPPGANVVRFSCILMRLVKTPNEKKATTTTTTTTAEKIMGQRAPHAQLAWHVFVYMYTNISTLIVFSMALCNYKPLMVLGSLSHNIKCTRLIEYTIYTY